MILPTYHQGKKKLSTKPTTNAFKMMTPPNNTLINQSFTKDFYQSAPVAKEHELRQSQHLIERRPSTTSDSSTSDEEGSIDDDNQLYRKALDSLGPYDVISGRGSLAFNNIGNRRFRILIGLNLDRYSMAEGRHQKGKFIGNLVNEIMNEIGAKFFKYQKGQLIELTETQIRQKVGHALRDTLVFQASQQKLQQKKKTEERKQKKRPKNRCYNRDVTSTMESQPSTGTSSTQMQNPKNGLQALHVAPPVPPPRDFTDDILQGRIQSFDFPSTLPNSDGDRRASILEAQDFSTMIETGKFERDLRFFPVTASDQLERRREQQQNHHQHNSLKTTSVKEFERWMWGIENNVHRERDGNNGGEKNAFVSHSLKKDPFEDIDFIPIQVDDLLKEKYNDNKAYQV